MRRSHPSPNGQWLSSQWVNLGIARMVQDKLHYAL
jgi:hypothetical protein